MTDMMIDKDSTEPFWSRVRGALGALRAAPQAEQSAYGQPAIARAIGMRPKLDAVITEELARGWASAAGRHVSLSLLVIELDCMNDYMTAYGRAAADDCTASVLQAITANLPREADTCLRWGTATFVLVLPDLPVLMARASAAKINDAVRHLGLAHKESHAGAVTVSMGLAVNNPRGVYDKKFFNIAMDALKKAQRKGLGRVETIDLRPAQDRKRKKVA
ncbi:MAG: diguanylate cyclase domain-containing protein [Devosia sp.]